MATLPLLLGPRLGDVLHPHQRLHQLLEIQRVRVHHRVHQPPHLRGDLHRMEDLQENQGVGSARDGFRDGYSDN